MANDQAPSTPHGLLTPWEAADYLRTTPSTLNTWRCRGRGPAYVKRGKSVLYKRSDLDAFINANRHEAGSYLPSGA